MSGLTRAQQRDLAAAVIRRCAALVEFDELLPESCRGVAPVALGAQLTVWLKDLPGDGWDSRLPQPGGAR